MMKIYKMDQIFYSTWTKKASDRDHILSRKVFVRSNLLYSVSQNYRPQVAITNNAGLRHFYIGFTFQTRKLLYVHVLYCQGFTVIVKSYKSLILHTAIKSRLLI